MRQVEGEIFHRINANMDLFNANTHHSYYLIYGEHELVVIKINFVGAMNILNKSFQSACVTK